MSANEVKRARDSLAESDRSGKFVRVDSAFRDIISVNHPIFKPEVGRYHLYISLAW
jgi:glutathionyl-hydroquinone reductase